MYRDSENTLTSWYNNKRRKPLVIRGARQVGKSTLVQRFAQSSGLTLHEINLEKHLSAKPVIGTNDPSTIRADLEFRIGNGPIKQGDLLFIDEIQAIPEAIGSLRYFYENQPELAVIAAGSLLEFALQRANFSMPVGRVEFLYQNPMNFLEFCKAVGRQDLYDLATHASLFEPIPLSAHQQLLQLQRIYMFVGGMPEAVATYIETNSFTAVQQLHRSLLDSYRYDFSKYSSNQDTTRLQTVLNNLPRTIGTKVKYSAIDPLDRAANVKRVLGLLTMAQVLTKVSRSKATGIPLKGSEDPSAYKNYFVDCGLLATMLGLEPIITEAFMDRKAYVNEGPLAEQYVAQHLSYFNGDRQEPYCHYWLKEGYSNAEVDFLVQNNDCYSIRR
jgi:predicted AAA+ superfamily ATPase